MKRYLNIFLIIFKLNYIRTINHRGEFISGMIGSLAWGFFSVIFMLVLTSRSEFIFGWSRAELFVLTGVFNIVVGSFFRSMNAENFDRMTSKIQHGDLDGILLKPVDSQFILSYSHIKLHGFIRMSVAILFTIFVFILTGISTNVFNILLFTIYAFIGYIIIYSIWYLIMTFAIWLPDTNNLNEILYNTDGFTRVPPQVIFSINIGIILILVPYIFVVGTPTKALIGKLTFGEGLLAIGVAVSLYFLSRKFWKFALRYYSSASG